MSLKLTLTQHAGFFAQRRLFIVAFSGPLGSFLSQLGNHKVTVGVENNSLLEKKTSDVHEEPRSRSIQSLINTGETKILGLRGLL